MYVCIYIYGLIMIAYKARTRTFMEFCMYYLALFVYENYNDKFFIIIVLATMIY
jgi:hypothetical protein